MIFYYLVAIEDKLFLFIFANIHEEKFLEHYHKKRFDWVP